MICNIKDSSIVKIFKIPFQILYGAYKIRKLGQPIITVFGGSRLSQNDPFSTKAHQFTHMLSEEHISVITGGGPGIMHASSCALVEEKRPERAKTLGIQVEGLDGVDGKAPADDCHYERVVVDYFFTRKYLLVNYSTAFVAFPGGFGTLDEVAEVATLIQTENLSHVPLILIGVEYWKPLMDWIDKAIGRGLIDKEGLDLIRVTDDLEEALCWVQECEKKFKEKAKKKD